MPPPLQPPKIVEKPWGREIWYAHTDRYAGKVLEVTAGHLLSLQKHRVKHETLYLLSGEIRLEVGTSPEALEDVRLGSGESFRVSPGTVHRIVAVTDADVLEASTPHLEDVIRFQDRYGRAPEGDR